MKRLENITLKTLNGKVAKERRDGEDQEIRLLHLIEQHIGLAPGTGPEAAKLWKFGIKLVDFDKDVDSFDLEDAEFDIVQRVLRPAADRQIYSAIIYGQVEDALEKAEVIKPEKPIKEKK